MQKTQSDIQQVLSATSTNGFPRSPGSDRDLDIGTAVIHEDGTVVRSSVDDQMSTRGIKSPSPSIQPVSIADANDNDNEPVSAVPTIRISTESSRDKNGEEEESGQEKSANEDKDDKEESESESKDTVDRKKEKGKAKEVYDDDQKTSQDKPPANGAVQQNGVKRHTLERPVQAAGEEDIYVYETAPAPAQEPFSFSNKRLCERWLDNLFMVLYEVGYPFFLVDLRSFNNRLT